MRVTARTTRPHTGVLLCLIIAAVAILLAHILPGAVSTIGADAAAPATVSVAVSSPAGPTISGTDTGSDACMLPCDVSVTDSTCPSALASDAGPVAVPAAAFVPAGVLDAPAPQVGEPSTRGPGITLQSLCISRT